MARRRTAQATTKRLKKAKARLGDVFAIPISGGRFGYAKVHQDCSIGLYELISNKVLPLDEVRQAKIVSWTMFVSTAIAEGNWTLLGNEPFASEEESWAAPKYCYASSVDAYQINHKGVTRNATKEEVAGLEQWICRFAACVVKLIEERIVPKAAERA